MKIYYKWEQAESEMIEKLMITKRELDRMRVLIDKAHEEEQHLDIIYDQELELEDEFQDFEKYFEFWEFVFDWKTQKDEWMTKPLIQEHEQNAMDRNLVNHINQTVERGNKVLQRVEPFFKKNDEKILDLLHFMNNQILSFQKTKELIGLVKDDSFKESQWQVIWAFSWSRGESWRAFSSANPLRLKFSDSRSEVRS